MTGTSPTKHVHFYVGDGTDDNVAQTPPARLPHSPVLSRFATPTRTPVTPVRLPSSPVLLSVHSKRIALSANRSVPADEHSTPKVKEAIRLFESKMTPVMPARRGNEVFEEVSFVNDDGLVVQPNSRKSHFSFPGNTGPSMEIVQTATTPPSEVVTPSDQTVVIRKAENYESSPQIPSSQNVTVRRRPIDRRQVTPSPIFPSSYGTSGPLTSTPKKTGVEVSVPPRWSPNSGKKQAHKSVIQELKTISNAKSLLKTSSVSQTSPTLTSAKEVEKSGLSTSRLTSTKPTSAHVKPGGMRMMPLLRKPPVPPPRTTSLKQPPASRLPQLAIRAVKSGETPSKPASGILKRTDYKFAEAKKSSAIPSYMRPTQASTTKHR